MISSIINAARSAQNYGIMNQLFDEDVDLILKSISNDDFLKLLSEYNCDAILLKIDCLTYYGEISGYIIKDKRKRFNDGSLVRTSRVLDRNKISDKIEITSTRNTKYLTLVV